MKSLRQAKIMDIIQRESVQTQEQLVRRLEADGFDVQQGTISRDIKQLGLIKVPDAEGTYRYALPAAEEDSGVTGRLATIFREGAVSAQSAQNIVVIKTLPGLASAVCAAIDAMRRPDVVGTLAGDDTGMIVLTDSGAADALAAYVRTQLRG